MKKMYNQPKTDVLAVETEYMMLDPVSGGGNASDQDTIINGD